MSAALLCRELAEKGVTLEAEDGKVRCKAPAGVLTAELRERITSAKDELLALLDPEAMRDQLLALAEVQGIATRPILALDRCTLLSCIGLHDDVLAGYVRGLERDERMAAGRLPPGWDFAATCEGCGPVWLPEGSPPLVIACPWCWHRKAGTTLPRPPVSCGECRHFLPDAINPEAGIGRCGLTAKPSNYPMALHECGDFRLASD
jgi:hypothetical protein